jgi:hypothetical protein
MGPITSMDPPTGALSNPSNGRDGVSVREKPSRAIPLRRARCRSSHCLPQIVTETESDEFKQCDGWPLCRRRVNALLNAVLSDNRQGIPRGEGDGHR